jgi:hypothetical protein
MLFIKRAKIVSTRFYEFFEGGNIDTIATSPDKLARRTNQATFSDLRKSGIHKAFGEFVVHKRTVLVRPPAPQNRSTAPMILSLGVRFRVVERRPFRLRELRGHIRRPRTVRLDFTRFFIERPYHLVMVGSSDFSRSPKLNCGIVAQFFA